MSSMINIFGAIIGIIRIQQRKTAFLSRTMPTIQTYYWSIFNYKNRKCINFEEYYEQYSNIIYNNVYLWHSIVELLSRPAYDNFQLILSYPLWY